MCNPRSMLACTLCPTKRVQALLQLSLRDHDEAMWCPEDDELEPIAARRTGGGHGGGAGWPASSIALFVFWTAETSYSSSQLSTSAFIVHISISSAERPQHRTNLCQVMPNPLPDLLLRHCLVELPVPVFALIVKRAPSSPYDGHGGKAVGAAGGGMRSAPKCSERCSLGSTQMAQASGSMQMAQARIYYMSDWNRFVRVRKR